MDLFFRFRECICRAAERKKTLIFFAAVYLIFFIFGASFAKSDATFEYNRNLCDRFVDRVCYSDTDVFTLFFSRFSGHIALLLLALAGSLHPAAMILPAFVLVYRAFTFGGSLVIFFTVYGASGAVIVFILYLPIHLLIDGALLLAAGRASSKCACFSFRTSDFFDLLFDFLCFGLIVAAVCIVEGVLLFALFHPLGNIL